MSTDQSETEKLIQSLHDETAMWDADGVVGPMFRSAALALELQVARIASLEAENAGLAAIIEQMTDAEEMSEGMRELGLLFSINEDEAYTGDGDYPSLTECIRVGDVASYVLHLTAAQSPADALKAVKAEAAATALDRAIEMIEAEHLHETTGSDGDMADDIAYDNAISDAGLAVRALLLEYRSEVK